MEERIKVREVTGVFHSRDALEAAVGALLESGFDRADIDIMAGANAIVEKLGGIYAPHRGTGRRAGSAAALLPGT